MVASILIRPKGSFFFPNEKDILETENDYGCLNVEDYGLYQS